MLFMPVETVWLAREAQPTQAAAVEVVLESQAPDQMQLHTSVRLRQTEGVRGAMAKIPPEMETAWPGANRAEEVVEPEEAHQIPKLSEAVVGWGKLF
jgi:hypothetical protein